MPRNMSFSLTTEQIRLRQKDVTRRIGWWFLKPNDIVNAVEKSMGLRKGDRINHLCKIRILSTRKEPLNAITDDDVAREGFVDWDRQSFMALFCEHNRCSIHDPVNRIEFEYLLEACSDDR